MSTRKQTVILILLLSLLPVVPGHGSDGWRIEFTRDGITVSTRAIPGTPLREFRAEGDINATMERVQEILMDIALLTTWQPDCIQSRLLVTADRGRILITYNETRAPWPVYNRDVVTQSTVTVTRDIITHDICALDRPDLVPPARGKVRITDLEAKWTLTRKGQATGAVLQARADPGGLIPAWIVNQFSSENPYKTLVNLRRMVAR